MRSLLIRVVVVESVVDAIAQQSMASLLSLARECLLIVYFLAAPVHHNLSLAPGPNFGVHLKVAPFWRAPNRGSAQGMRELFEPEAEEEVLLV